MISLLIVALGVLLLLILVSIVVGLLEGMNLTQITASIYKGVGGQLSSLILILAFGAMLGKILSDSGAAQKIAMSFTKMFGVKNVHWAMFLTSFIIGITMFFDAAFIVIMPLIFTVVAELGLSLIAVGLPAIIALSITHGFLPPHPGPTAVVLTYGADMGKTILYGFILALPISLVLGGVFSRLNFIKYMKSSIPEGLVTTKVFKEEELPSFSISLFVALVPIFLMAAGSVASIFIDPKMPQMQYIHFFAEAPIALLVSVLVGTYVLGVKRGTKLEEVMQGLGASVKPICMIALVIAGGSAFKQVILDSGVGDVIAEMTGGMSMSPIVLAWIIAAGIRVAVGSATVAVTTASGIILPMLASSNVSPEIMVLATACGSVFASHVNDSGFWLCKEYFNLSVIDALKTRTLYTAILSVMGLLGCLLLNMGGL